MHMMLFPPGGFGSTVASKPSLSSSSPAMQRCYPVSRFAGEVGPHQAGYLQGNRCWDAESGGSQHATNNFLEVFWRHVLR